MDHKNQKLLSENEESNSSVSDSSESVSENEDSYSESDEGLHSDSCNHEYESDHYNSDRTVTLIESQLERLLKDCEIAKLRVAVT